jgi:hypothetical protein
MDQQRIDPKAERLSLKAAECFSLAEGAYFPETRQAYRSLALSYLKLAAQAQRNWTYDQTR